MMSQTTSHSKRTPENKNNNVNDIIPAAKRNFLTATDKLSSRSPLKRQASPESESLEKEALSSPRSLKKHPSITLGTPPKKQPKFWKTRWQEKINGTLAEKGPRRKKNEADKLLVMASAQVVDLVLDEHSTTVAELEEMIGKSIRFQREEQYTQELFDVVLL